MKFFSKFLIGSATFFGLNNLAIAQEVAYPNVTGQVLFEFKTDNIITKSEGHSPRNNSYINIEPDFSLNIDKNWSVKTGWRIFPMTPRSSHAAFPEKTRIILSENRGFNQDDTGVVIEELKLHFQNDDLKIFAGKFNPTFATMYRKTKRIGVFVTDFTEEYELREKIGAGVSAMLEDSVITANTFFNDVTDLSKSAIHNRGKESTNDGLAGNTSTLSSYTFTIEGQNLLGYENLFYNFGYRNLDVANHTTSKRETGYTFNLEYLHKVSANTSVIPLIEVVKIKNFTGHPNRDATYITTSLIGKYSSWNASITSVFRNIDNNYYNLPKTRDNQLQISVGYKFSNNISLDVSRVSMKENNVRATLIGVMLSYLYKF